MKRLFAVFAAAVFVFSAAHAQQPAPSCATPGTDNAFLGIQTIRLWPGPAPQAKGDGCYDIPALTIFDPQKGTGNGSAVVIFPGGGYSGLAGNLEGRQFADWFAARGFRAFILSYRLSSHGYLLPVPLIDARRAIQLVRARARDYQIDPNRIVVIGFSAGGHLAALAGAQFVPGNPNADDPIDRVSSRPDYLILGYPWIGAMTADTAHISYCKAFNVMDQCDQFIKNYSPDQSVTANTPPTFMYHTFADKTVPVEQTLGFYEALVKAGVPAELHIFVNGGHGSGLGKGDLALDLWPNLLENWLRGYGLLTVDKTATGAPQ